MFDMIIVKLFSQLTGSQSLVESIPFDPIFLTRIAPFILSIFSILTLILFDSPKTDRLSWWESRVTSASLAKLRHLFLTRQQQLELPNLASFSVTLIELSSNLEIGFGIKARPSYCFFVKVLNFYRRFCQEAVISNNPRNPHLGSRI